MCTEAGQKGTTVGTFVVGVFDNHRSILTLAQNLSSGGVDTEKLRVVGNEEIPTELAAANADYVYLGDVERSSLVNEPGDYETGTGVPGMTTSLSQTLGFTQLGDYLSDLGIPDGKSDTYANLVDDGKWLAGYLAQPDTLEKIKSTFTSSGASSVEVF